MLLQRRFQIFGQAKRKPTRGNGLFSNSGSKGFQNRCVQIEDQTGSSSASTSEDLSDLCKGFKVRDIVIETSRVTGVPTDLILCERRDPTFVYARHIIFYLAVELTGYSLPKIGHILTRDHTTIMYGRDKMKRLLQTDEKLQETINTIKECLMNGKE